MPKKQITVWVSETVFDALKDRADEEHADLSPVTASVLARAVADGVPGSLRYAPVIEAFQTAVAKATRDEVEVIAGIASRTALYTIAGRFQIRWLLIKRLGEVQARAVQTEAWRRAVELLRQPIEADE